MSNSKTKAMDGTQRQAKSTPAMNLIRRTAAAAVGVVALSTLQTKADVTVSPLIDAAGGATYEKAPVESINNITLSSQCYGAQNIRVSPESGTSRTAIGPGR